jgi:hypothetical protein
LALNVQAAAFEARLKTEAAMALLLCPPPHKVSRATMLTNWIAPQFSSVVTRPDFG